eukprot:TRINITY_DN14093_c0_g1_i1.p1 TRINITY_DN14093_c0_g1~~TRINITY_DN14093_c0_g1_i1.p1  ORF type:complete len:186 (+),score=45.94 TRINITY_DN14093_c0_g1_i1:113-670(+)
MSICTGICFFLMIRRPPRSTLSSSSAASDVYKRQKFSSAHFACYHGSRERLHGHNYRVAVVLTGSEVGQGGYLIDFGDVKRVMRAICKDLDEYMLVPLRSVAHEVGRETAGQIEVRCEDGSFFSFPETDCKLLPLSNTSVEELAQYVWGRMMDQIDFRAFGIEWVQVEITETQGQCASFGRRPKL